MKAALANTKDWTPNFSIRDTVILLRPHLWSGCPGEVESIKTDRQIYYLLICGKEGAEFHTEAKEQYMKEHNPFE